MDYSQKDQTNSQAFFTAGVGDTPVEQNDTGESLDTSAWSPDFELPDNSREIGGRAIQLSKERAEIEAASKQLMLEEESKRAMDLSQPQIPVPEAIQSTIQYPKNVRADDGGERISRATFAEIGKVDAEFDQTHDAAAYNDKIREMGEQYTKNSYPDNPYNREAS